MKRIYHSLDDIKKNKGKIKVVKFELGNISKGISNETSTIIADILTKKIVDSRVNLETKINNSECSEKENENE